MLCRIMLIARLTKKALLKQKSKGAIKQKRKK